MSEPNWELLGGAGTIGGPIDYIGDWAAGVTYQPGQIVRYNGIDYIAVNPSIGQIPPVASPLSLGMVCLYDSILSADAASFDIQNIPQGYTNLRLLVSLRSNQAGQTDHITMRFNNDAAAVWYVLATGWIAGAAFNSYVSNGATKGACGMAIGATGDAGTFGESDILIPDYASSTKKKILTALSGAMWSAALNAHSVLKYSGIWGTSTAPINRITLLPNAGTLWLAGSRVTLYGLPTVGQAAPVTTLAPGGIGTSFPVSPTNGETFTLVDSLTAPTYAWDFRYVASITDSYKWVFIGGSPIRSYAGSGTAPSLNTWVAFADNLPAVTVPRNGLYAVSISFRGLAIASQNYMGVSAEGRGPQIHAGTFGPVGGGHVANAQLNELLECYSGVRTFRMNVYQNASYSWDQRVLSAIPVRVS